MRKPTDPYIDQEWWREALAGNKPPLYDGEPHPGWYKYRKYKGGPWIPVYVWRHADVDEETGELLSDEILYAIEDGRRYTDPRDMWLWYAVNPISVDDYLNLVSPPEDDPEPPQRLSEAPSIF